MSIQNYDAQFRDAENLENRIYYRTKGSYGSKDRSCLVVTREANGYIVWTQHQGPFNQDAGMHTMCGIDIDTIHSVREEALDRAGDIWRGWQKAAEESK
jgi:hypothetical protein